MDNKDQALRPEFINIPSFINKKREQDVVELTEEEKVLAQGAEQSFWAILKKHLNNEMIQLEKINEVAIEHGMPFEEIGRNTIVISQVKGVLTRIFNVVEDAKEASENGK